MKTTSTTPTTTVTVTINIAAANKFEGNNEFRLHLSEEALKALPSHEGSPFATNFEVALQLAIIDYLTNNLSQPEPEATSTPPLTEAEINNLNDYFNGGGSIAIPTLIHYHQLKLEKAHLYEDKAEARKQRRILRNLKAQL